MQIAPTLLDVGPYKKTNLQYMQLISTSDSHFRILEKMGCKITPIKNKLMSISKWTEKNHNIFFS